MTGGSTTSALVVDGDEFFCLAVRTILGEQLGFGQVSIVPCLAQAETALRQAPDTVLALVSHSAGGLRAIRDLGGFRDRFPRPRLVFVAGNEDRGDILAALDTGLHGFVPKALGLAGLAGALRQILDGAIYVPPSIARREARALWTEPERRAVHPPTPDAIALTPRQHDVLRHIVEGKSNKEIARSLGLGEGTVKVHVAALFRTLGLTSRSAAAAIGARILADAANTNAARGVGSAQAAPAALPAAPAAA